MENRIAVITIPVAIPMAKSLLKKTGYSGDIREMTLDEYGEILDKFASQEKAE